MVDWTSPEELASNAVSAVKIVHVVAGIYLWEYTVSLDFEWSFLQGKRRFNWPMIPYFLGRYFALAMVITELISNNVTTGLNCESIITTTGFFVGATFGFSSMNLAIRTMIMWNMKWACVVPLCLLSIAQWVMIIIDATVIRASSQPGQGCSIAQTWAYYDQSAALLLGLSLDFLALILNIVKVFVLNHGRRSQLVNVVLQDGIIYFVVSVLVNIPSAVLALLELNIILGYFTVILASVLSAIAACRVVRRLSNFSTDGPVIYMTTTKHTAPMNVSNNPNVIQVQMDGLAGSQTPSSEATALSKNENSPYV